MSRKNALVARLQALEAEVLELARCSSSRPLRSLSALGQSDGEIMYKENSLELDIPTSIANFSAFLNIDGKLRGEYSMDVYRSLTKITCIIEDKRKTNAFSLRQQPRAPIRLFIENGQLTYQKGRYIEVSCTDKNITNIDYGDKTNITSFADFRKIFQPYVEGNITLSP
jgi:hypothetical protein